MTLWPDADLERSLLGELLKQGQIPPLPTDVDRLLGPDLFSDGNRFVARALLAVARRTGHCDIIHVHEEMKRSGAGLNTVQALGVLAEAAPVGNVDVPALVRLLAERKNGNKASENLPPEAPESDLPTFPEIAYQGLAGEIAHTYAQCLEAPKQFLYVDSLTFLGATVSKMVRLDSELREEPRLFNVKVAASWAGRKSSAQETVERLYAPLLQDRVTMCYGAGSAEGLQRIMQSGLPTVLVYDEFRAFVDKAGVQQSVLLPMVATLFHRTVYENSTKNSEIRLPDAHLSLMAACTSETFTTMFSSQFRNIGFLNRLFVVAGKRESLHPIPQTVSANTVERLQQRTLAQVERAERDRPALRFTNDARVRWEEWYRSMPETPYAARLDTYGLRLLMLFAVTTENWQITRPLVDAVIPLLDYELAVRRELDPVDAEGVVARLERLILRHLQKGRMPESRLQDRCNVRYYGLWAYELALKNVMGQDWVRMTKAGRGRQMWLTEAGLEAVSQ